MAQLRTRRSQEEWLELIQECRCSGMTDRDWCDQHGIVVSSFYNAVKRLRKKACDIPYTSNKKSYALDLTSNKQDVVQIDIYPDHDPEADAVPLPQTPAVHLDNSHTIEVAMNMKDITVRISNDVDPLLLTRTFRLLRELSC